MHAEPVNCVYRRSWSDVLGRTYDLDEVVVIAVGHKHHVDIATLQQFVVEGRFLDAVEYDYRYLSLNQKKKPPSLG